MFHFLFAMLFLVFAFFAAFWKQAECQDLSSPTETLNYFYPKSSRAFPIGMANILRGGTDTSPADGIDGFPCQAPSAKPRRMFAYPWENRGDNEDLVDYYKVL
jgi:hypothetical protein